MKLSGHTILITGGSSGIGFSLAKRFLQLENKVIIVGRNEEKLAAAKSQLPTLITYVCDLSRTDERETMVHWLINHYPNLNILVNNAGIQHNYTLLDDKNAVSKIYEEIEVNLITPLVLCTQVLPILSIQTEAAIINVSSGLGLSPKRSAPVYCSTKSGLHIFTKALRYQLEHTSIKVFEIIPPLVDTEMTRGRGKHKISADRLVAEFIVNFKKNQFEVSIGKVKLLKMIQRLWPSLADRLLKNS